MNPTKIMINEDIPDTINAIPTKINPIPNNENCKEDRYLANTIIIDKSIIANAKFNISNTIGSISSLLI